MGYTTLNYTIHPFQADTDSCAKKKHSHHRLNDHHQSVKLHIGISLLKMKCINIGQQTCSLTYFTN